MYMSFDFLYWDGNTEISWHRLHLSLCSKYPSAWKKGEIFDILLFVFIFFFVIFSVIQPVLLIMVARNTMPNMEMVLDLEPALFQSWLLNFTFHGNDAKAPSKCQRTLITFQEDCACVANLFHHPGHLSRQHVHVSTLNFLMMMMVMSSGLKGLIEQWYIFYNPPSLGKCIHCSFILWNALQVLILIMLSISVLSFWL